MGQERAITPELKSRIRRLCTKYLDGLERRDIKLTDVARVLGVTKNSVYSWRSTEAPTVPTRMSFTRLHGLYFCPDDQILYVMVAIKQARALRAESSLYDVMKNLGALPAASQKTGNKSHSSTSLGAFSLVPGLGALLGGLAGLALAGSPVGWTISGLLGIAGLKSFGDKTASQLSLPRKAVRALELDPTAPWKEIADEAEAIG